MKFVFGVGSILLATLFLLALWAQAEMAGGDAVDEAIRLKQAVESLVFDPSAWFALVFSMVLIVIGVKLLVPKRWTPIEEPVHFLLIEREKTIHPPDPDLS